MPQAGNVKELSPGPRVLPGFLTWKDHHLGANDQLREHQELWLSYLVGS